ncbi:hypothetical protein [Litoribacter populi]|nr:hypothetical protein [Litoribacter populi]
MRKLFPEESKTDLYAQTNFSKVAIGGFANGLRHEITLTVE